MRSAARRASGWFGVVPFARRTLVADRKRSAISALGVGLALMMVLLLYGLWNGIDRRLVAYGERSGAQLFVAQPGTSSMIGGVSQIPKSTVDVVRRDPDVSWAAPVRGMFSVTRVGSVRVPSYLVGYEPGHQGGPWAIAEGRAPAAVDEVAVGQLFGRRAGVQVGSKLSILGKELRVVGVAADADMFMASFVFLPHAATDAMLAAPDTTSFVLVGTDNPDAVMGRLNAAGLNAVPQSVIAQNDLALKSAAYTTGMRAMLLVSFGIGCIVVALTTYTGIVDRRRDYGIIKALGATRPRLLRIVVGQSCVLSCAGLVVGMILYLGGKALLDIVRPEFAITIGFENLAKALAATVVMGVVSSIIPAHRLAVIEPAVAYKGV